MKCTLNWVHLHLVYWLPYVYDMCMFSGLCTLSSSFLLLVHVLKNENILKNTLYIDIFNSNDFLCLKQTMGFNCILS